MTSRNRSEISIVHTTTASARRGCITVHSGEGAGASITLGMLETVSIGRNERSCDLIIPSRDISRVHCTAEYDAEKCAFIITDRSMNGVYIDGQRLPKNIPVILPSGTILYLANNMHSIRLI